MEVKLFQSAYVPGEWVASVDFGKYFGHTSVGETKHDALENLAQYWRRADGENKADMSGWFFARREA